ncbi:MAG TPA: NAD-dependent epimerase/dehydratase family protein [Terracidiphilus sp.]|jgi:nucleoside-diphosphate-sugar epimerase|nr:NAD-dependent epimerase/dehydratase family protein [Terracidiphilus sp.]
MITILGAGGVISDELARLLAARKLPLRLVSRRGVAMPGTAETVVADLSDKGQTIEAVAGSSVVYLLAGLKYDHRVWAEMWPRIMANTIEACKGAGARLIFFDNVYMYGRVRGAMTEETPFNPCSKKGEVRARIATNLIDQWKTGGLTAMIARAADFYGPQAKTGVANALVFEPMSKGQKAMCLVNDSVPHSYTYTPDAALALLKLAESEPAWNQTWHLPTAASALTGKEFIARAAEAMGIAPQYRVLSRSMVRVFGWFNPTVGEVYEMLYQNDSPYLFDSSKYAKAFGFAGTPYAEGIRVTAASYRTGAGK